MNNYICPQMVFYQNYTTWSRVIFTDGNRQRKLLCGGGTNMWMPLQFLCSQYSSIDLFSFYVLFSHFRPSHATRGNSFFQMSSHAHANVCITNEKYRRKIPMRASRGLKWENKMYKLKRPILRWISRTHQKHQSSSQKVYLQKSNFTTLSFS